MKASFPLMVPECKPIGMQEGRTLFRLTKPFIFYVDSHKYEIPEMFVFDGASIPFGFRNTFNPSDTRYMASALIHDWLYAGEYCPRKYADQCFLSAMEYQMVSKAKRKIMYAAVRIGGGFTYMQHTEKTVMNIRRLSGLTINTRPLWEVL